jgi:hypothetical protein
LNYDFTVLQPNRRKPAIWEATFKPWLILWGANTMSLKR